MDKRCLDCDWRVRATDGTERDRSREAIDHYANTGHTITSGAAADRAERDARVLLPDWIGV